MEKNIRKVIITGGAGFIGSHLVESLLNKTDTEMIYIIDSLMRTNSLRNIQHLLDNPLTSKRLKFIHSDISNVNFDSIVDASQIDYVFHLASPRINRIDKFNSEGHYTIAHGGFKLIDWISKYNIKLFFASTASVYASPKKFPIEETDNCNPYTIYGAAKFYTENLIRSYNRLYALEYTINRFFSVYGVRMDNEGVYTEVVYNFLKQIKDGNDSIYVHGDPDEKVIDMVYVTDVVNAIMMTTFDYSNRNTTFNVCTGTGTTLRQLLNIMQEVTNKKVNIVSVKDPRTDVEAKRIGSNNKLKSIGWKPEIDLYTGINNTWRWINGK